MVLLQDGLGRTYRGQQTLSLKLMVSNYSEEEMRQAHLQWRLMADERVLKKGSVTIPRIDQGSLATLATFIQTLPEIDAPRHLTLAVELRANGKKYRNSWTA